MFSLEPNASVDAIKDAYRNIVRKCPPDKLVNGTAEERLVGDEYAKRLNNAYQILSGPVTRAAYDLTRSQHPYSRAGRLQMPKLTRTQSAGSPYRQYAPWFTPPYTQPKARMTSTHHTPSWRKSSSHSPPFNKRPEPEESPPVYTKLPRRSYAMGIMPSTPLSRVLRQMRQRRLFPMTSLTTMAWFRMWSRPD
jgi:curved DNA-binding protein CbpA